MITLFSAGLLLLMIAADCDAAESPSTELRIVADGAKTVEIFATYSMTPGKPLEADSETDASDLVLVWAGDGMLPDDGPGLACTDSAFDGRIPSGGGKWAALVSRGSCTFTEKVARAQAKGAEYVVISNNVPALYKNASAKWLKDPCVANCELGSADDEATCAASPSCSSGKCVQNPRTDSSEGGWCCFLDELQFMSVNASIASIPALFITSSDSDKITALPTSSNTIKAWKRPYATIDFSLILIFLIGVGTVAGASYRACEPYRSAAFPSRDETLQGHRQSRQGGTNGNSEDEEEEVEITQGMAVCFLVMATVGLVAIFLLSLKWPHVMVIILNVLFMLGCITPLKRIFFKPLLSICASKYDKKCFVLFRDTQFEWQATLLDFITLFIAAATSITWFCGRHSTWAWVLQDLLAMAIIVVFLMTIKIPNLKIGALILGLFFLYDIFMVFISPLIFGGKSVMLQVATAGKGTQKIESHECVRTQEERMPMLFLVPRFSWLGQGTYSMLGLGDVVFPGLLLTLALRIDYAMLTLRGRPRIWPSSRIHSFLRLDLGGYFPILVIMYAVGLICTFAALLLDFTILNVKGQPALLYLVPCTVGGFYLASKLRGEFSEVWRITWSDENGAVPANQGTLDISKRGSSSGSQSRRSSASRMPLETEVAAGGTLPLLSSIVDSENAV